MADCWPCAPQRKDIPMSDWDMASLRSMVNGLFSCCPKHKAEMQKEIEKRDGEGPKKYVLKQEPQTYMPPIPKEPVRDYNEPREPGEEG